MTTRGLEHLIIPVERRLACPPHPSGPSVLITDLEVRDIWADGKSTGPSAAWTDDLSTPGATFIAWNSRGDITAGCGYAYLDPRRLGDHSLCEVIVAAVDNTSPPAEELEGRKFIIFSVQTGEPPLLTRYRSLIRPLPAEFALHLPRLSRLHRPSPGTALRPTSLLLAGHGDRFLLWAEDGTDACCWTEDYPCDDALRYGGRLGQEIHPLPPDLSVRTSASELTRAIRDLTRHALTPRLQGL
jgi:hypothetical protein